VIILTSGDVISTGIVQSNQVQLLVGPIYAKKWIVQPSLVGPPLSQSGLDKITLDLHYEDAANAYTSDKTMVFTGPGAGEPWPLDLRDPSMRDYTYKVTYEETNGFDHVLGPASSSDTFLVLPTTPPAE
jgi:hypothetical protein